MTQNQRTFGIWRIIVLVVILLIGLIVIALIGKDNRSDDVILDTYSVPTSTVSDNVFSDGLENPSNVRHFEPDDYGAGVTEIAEYVYDINHDGRPDRITRSRVENGTAHFQYVYKIELNNGQTYTDITPNGFYTVEGSECAHQKLQFSFKPDFSVIKISRPMGDDWNTPTQSTKTTFAIRGQRIHMVSSIEYKTVCDVAEL